jgi:hypothetical protein
LVCERCFFYFIFIIRKLSSLRIKN